MCCVSCVGKIQRVIIKQPGLSANSMGYRLNCLGVARPCLCVQVEPCVEADGGKEAEFSSILLKGYFPVSSAYEG